MDKLPTEILNRIFLKLHYSQRARCALVCRYWATHIHSFNLLDDLTIEGEKTSTFRLYDPNAKDVPRQTPTFEAWEKRITENPRWGKQVRQLLLISCLTKTEDFTALPTLFPFIRTLFLYQSKQLEFNLETTQSSQFEPWLDRLEKLVDASSHMFTYTVLGAGTFDYLVSIKLVYDETTSVSASDLFERFKHVPYLKNLELNRFELSFPLLETLHRHTPNLVSFKVENGLFSSDTFPPGVEPLPSLTSLKLYMGDFPVIRLQTWAKYFTLKYPNVKELEFNAGDLEMLTPGEDQTHTLVLNPMLQLLASRLESFTVSLYKFKPEWLAILEKEECKLHTLHMGSHFNSQTVIDLLPFRLFQNLSSLSINLARTVDFSWLESLTHLKVLKLDYMLSDEEEDMHSVYLNQLLFYAPATLDKLVLVRAQVTIEDTALMTNSNIKHLKIKHGGFDDLVIAFVAQYCLQVDTLSLAYNDDQVLDYNLPRHHLTYFEVTTPAEKTSVKVTTNKNTRIYQPNQQYTKVKRSMLKDTVSLTSFSFLKSTASAIVEIDEEAEKTIHLTCQSLQNLFINEHCAY